MASRLTTVTSMGTLNVASFGFVIGAIGQAILFDRWSSPLVSKLLFVALMVPWLTVFAISFCRVPPFGPRRFRLCLLFAMCCYAFFGVIAELSYDFVHPQPLNDVPLVVARVLIIVGAANFLVFVPAFLQLGHLESELGAKSSQK